MAEFKIPRQTDRALINALVAIREDLKWVISTLDIAVFASEHGPEVQVAGPEPEKAPTIGYAITEEAEIFPWFRLRDRTSGAVVVHITRNLSGIADNVVAGNEHHWTNQLQPPEKIKAYAMLLSSARKHLKAADIAANLSGGSDNEWRRYRP
jgi:hypothetical protein